MIVFGHGNFVIKKYKYDELGFPPGSDWEGVSFQVRQRYAHLFWIPFFPLAKLWVIKKPGDSNLYEMPADIKNVILALHKKDIKTPFTSWALFLIAMLVSSVYWINGELKSYKWETRREEKKALMKLRVDYPTTGDYYRLKIKDGLNSYSTIATYVKVVANNKDSVQIISINEELFADYSNYSRQVENTTIFKQFDLIEPLAFNEMNLSKEQLKKAVDAEFVYVKHLGDTRLEEVTRRKY